MADTPNAATLVAMVLLIAFVIDRIIAVVMFLAEIIPIKADDPRRPAYTKKIVYFFLSATLSAIALFIFPKLVLPLEIPGPWNRLLLWLILVGGADRISEFVGKSEAPEAAPAKQLHVTGTLSVDDEARKQLP